MAAEKASADRFAQAKTLAEKAEAEKAMQKAAAERVAAEKTASEKAAATKAAMEKAAAESAASEKMAVERVAAEKAATEKAATEKVAMEKAATQKEASEKATAAVKSGWPNVGDRWVYEARDAFHSDRKFPVTVEVKAITSSSVQDVTRFGNGAGAEWVYKPGAFLVGIAPGIFEFSPYMRAFQEIRSGESWPI